MLRFVAVAGAAVLLAILESAFCSHFPPPVSELSTALVGAGFMTATRHDDYAPVWALATGIIADIHGLFGFGATIALNLLVLAVLRYAFNRFLSNTSTLAAFLLTALGGLTYFLGLIFFDGLRIISGGVPYVIAYGSELPGHLVRFLLVNGAAVSLLVLVDAAVRQRLERAFLGQPTIARR